MIRSLFLKQQQQWL